MRKNRFLATLLIGTLALSSISIPAFGNVANTNAESPEIFKSFFEERNIPEEKYSIMTFDEQQSIYRQTNNYNLSDDKVVIMVDDYYYGRIASQNNSSNNLTENSSEDVVKNNQLKREHTASLINKGKERYDETTNFVSFKRDFRKYSKEELNQYFADKGFEEDDIKYMGYYDKYSIAAYIESGIYSINDIIDLYDLDEVHQPPSTAAWMGIVAKKAMLWEDEDFINYYLTAKLSLNQIAELFKETDERNSDRNLTYVSIVNRNMDYDDIIDIYDIDSPNTPYVYAQLPKFKITINGMVMDNANEEYPFIVYNDITYFPLTYNLTSFMGLESNYYEEPSELYITTSNEGAKDYVPYSNDSFSHKNKTYECSLPPYSIYIMNERILNSKEEYPFFNCNGVTYFPMTWDNTVTRFGFESEFTQENGLVINTK